MKAFRAVTESPEETQELGKRLGAVLEAGDLLLLQGTLGAGKTTLTQGIAWGAGVTGYAHSPTFVLVHEYEGRVRLYHLDLYRLEGGDLEVHDLGIEEMLTDGACVVEWAEKAPAVFPEEHLYGLIEFGNSPDQRLLTLTARGDRYERLLARLQHALTT